MTDSTFDVVGLGNAIVDVIAQATDDFLVENGVAKGSMRLIDSNEAESLYRKMGPGVEVSGGSAANTMAGLASLGGSAAFIGKVNDDDLGHVFAHDLRAAGVSFSTKPASDGAPTARSLILVTPDGERTMNTFLGASQDLGPADVDQALISSAALTYLEGYLWDPPGAKEAFTLAMDAAHRAGRRVALTLSDSFCVNRYRSEFADMLGAGVDVLFGNEEEICALFATDDFEAAFTLARSRCEVVAITRGERGSVLARGHHQAEVEADPTTVVDTTGAGDLYAAGVLFGLARDADLETCGRLGAMAAAEVISHLGARPQADLQDRARAAGLL